MKNILRLFFYIGILLFSFPACGYTLYVINNTEYELDLHLEVTGSAFKEWDYIGGSILAKKYRPVPYTTSTGTTYTREKAFGPFKITPYSKGHLGKVDLVCWKKATATNKWGSAINFLGKGKHKKPECGSLYWIIEQKNGGLYKAWGWAGASPKHRKWKKYWFEHLDEIIAKRKKDPKLKDDPLTQQYEKEYQKAEQQRELFKKITKDPLHYIP